MSEKKGTTVLLTVIGIATLLVTLVGATFAFFTAQVEGNDDNATDVVIEAAELGTIVFEHGNVINLDNIYPGTSQEVTFAVKPDDDASVDVAYDVYMIVTSNTFTSTNLQATLTAPTGTGDASNLVTATALNSTDYAATKEVKIGSGVIQPSETDNWNLKVELVEVGGEVAQNEDQAKTFTARLEVRATAQYTQQSVYGTGN